MTSNANCAAIPDLRLGAEALNRLFPMHVWVSPTGHIAHAGSTLSKLRPGQVLSGMRLLELFEFRRPRQITLVSDLIAHHGAALRLQFREAPKVAMKGIVVALPEGQGALLNLSLGITVVEDGGRYRLTARDFAPSDLTVEMLYLMEAKSAALNESKLLNQRLQGAKVAAEEQAFTDTLTGLKNRRAMDHVLSRLVDPVAGKDFGLMHIDLDYFKAVNDTLGHAAGDHVLQKVAQVLVEETRVEDTVARVGGDEFVLILRNCDSVELMERIARRIIDRLEEPIQFEGNECRISASIGATISTLYRFPDPARMLVDADTATYASKARGRACQTMFSEGLAAKQGAEPAKPQAEGAATGRA